MTAAQVLVKITRERILFRKNAVFVEVLTILQIFFKRIRKDKEKSHAAGDLEKRSTERTTHKCLRCGSEDQLLAKYPKKLQ